jgi:hypothetical protein
MDERTVLTLLAKMINRYLSRGDAARQPSPTFAVDIANATWDALILLLRQTLVTESTVTLTDVGIFERTADGWTFAPAASLTETASLKLSPDAGQADIAAMLVSHVQNAERLLDNLSRDIRVSASPPYDLQLRGETYDRAVSDVIHEFANRLRQKSDDLKSNTRTDTVPLLIAPSSTPSFFIGRPDSVIDESPFDFSDGPPLNSGI